MNILTNIGRVIARAVLAGSVSTGASAECAGTDLRLGLTGEDRLKFETTIAAIPFSTGNHWRATRGDKTVHVVGTIHLSDARLDPIATRLQGVIEASELLLLEMSPAEEEALKADTLARPELLFLQDATLPELLEEKDWDRLSGALKLRGIPPMLGSKFQPWYLSVLLGMPPCLAKSMMSGAQKGLDFRLRDIALASNIPMQGLEPHDTLFRLFTDDPLEEQIDMMLLGLETQDQSLDMLETVKAAYYEQRHAEAWEMSRRLVMQIQDQTPARLEALIAEMKADLLSGRNRAWIPVILAALNTRAQITVAAGAGHLSGKSGVLALLEAEGFHLQRLPF